MQRSSWIVPALIAVGFGSSLAYVRALRPIDAGTPNTALPSDAQPSAHTRLMNIPGPPSTAAAAEGPRSPVAMQAPASTSTVPLSPSVSSLPQKQLAAAALPPPDDVNDWVAQASDPDNQRRAVAIARLASAPRYQAAPVLKELTADKDDSVRRLAVTALATLALREGDYDGEIRNTLRQAMKDRNTQVQQRAQVALARMDAANAAAQ